MNHCIINLSASRLNCAALCSLDFRAGAVCRAIGSAIGSAIGCAIGCAVGGRAIRSRLRRVW